MAPAQSQAAPVSLPVETPVEVEDDGLRFSGRFAGGLRDDIARRLPWYLSDWTDGLRGGHKTVTAVLYMFFACLAPGIAEGAFINQVTGGQVGVVEYLITQGVAGVIHAIIGGQPLLILRPTGPITVFMSQLFVITKSLGLPYPAVMSWVGIFVGLYMVVVALTDACAAIRYCSRFTQDLFGCFVGVIFINLGVTNIVEKFTKKQHEYSAPVELLLTAATLYCAMQLAGFGKARLFTGRVRETIADFAAPLAVVAGTVVANLLTVEVESLPVPLAFGPTRSGRPWLVEVCPAETCGSCAAIGAIAAVPLFLLFFIDQNVTSLLTQHPDYKLQKGTSFHYNFFLTGIFNVAFPLFGCPYLTASLPHSPQFARALAKTEVECQQNGCERTVIKSVCENRVAPLLVNVLILVCLPLIRLLRVIPTAVVCDALFLFMGLEDLLSNPLFERLKLMVTERSLYPPLHFTAEEVPRTRMHVFTLFQAAYVAILYGVTHSPIALAFPLFLVSSIPVRMLLPQITGGFLTRDMVAILDHSKRSAMAEPINHAHDVMNLPQPMPCGRCEADDDEEASAGAAQL